MVNFMRHHGWAIVPRYLIKEHSGDYCTVALWMRLTLKSVVFVKSSLLPIMWMGLVQPVEELYRTKTDLPRIRRHPGSK